jgi:cell surface protein SprA
LGNVRNEPDFKQDVQIGVNGTVGDKLNIMADWNTQRTFEYENQLKIKYTGYEDEIVQSIEGGNVSLQTPSSFVGSSQALFGIKAQFQVGPLKLTTLASQKKGQVQEQTYSGGQHQSPFELHAYAYAQNHFFLDTVYRKQYESYYGNPQQPQYDFNLKVTDIEVWITNIGPDDPNQQYVVAKADLPDLTGGGRYPDSLHNLPAVSGQVEVGKFIKLKKDEQYFLHEATGFITLAQQVRDEQAVAVAYRTQDGRTYGDFLSTRIAGDTILILKLVKPRYLIPSMQYAWRLQLRSIYPVGGRGLKKEGFVMNIYYQLPGQEPQDNIQGGNNLLQVFGLDRTDESGTGPPDNKFDYIQGITIDEYRGELIFPSLEPFREGIRGYFQQKNIANPDSFIFADIYDTTLTAARNNGQRDRFLIKGKYIGSVTSTHNIGFNLVEGSVHVTLNGAELTPNVDYAVDYILGQVSIKNEAALVPGANLQIKYEQNDLFQFASKTLLGARGEFNFSKQTQFGFSILNLNQQTLSEKVRIGEEPISNTIMGIDGATTIKTPFITDALNLLPLIQQSREESNITLRGEAAYMLPDPNTKKSPIPVDNNEGIAYVDDFEGAKLYTPLGIGYAMWHSASPPAFHPTLGNIPDSTLINNEAKLIRYNIIPGDVLQRDIWPNKTPAYGEEYVTVLSLAYDPAARGEFNYKPDLSVPTNNWAGIMRLIPSNATNLVDNNYEFLEIWLQIEGGNPGNGKMIVDLGRISEDVVVNDKLDTEDGYDGGPRMQVLRAGEDVGLDALSNDQEKAKYADLIKKYSAQYPDYANDPSGDDYYYAGAGSDDFSHVNGTEGNGTSETGRFPDTEDLNNNGVLDRVNNYFEYEINLDTSAARNPQIVGGGSKGWYQYKIPLSQYMRKVGDPDFSIVEFVRVWLTGFPGKVWIRIADVSLSGNQWLAVKPKGALSDSSFVVSVVNIEDNPSYSSPPDLPRARDLTRPDQTILVNEQSLALLISNLADGESRYAYRTYSARPLDVFNYKILRMFVHCDEHFNYVDTSNYDCEFFFRFGVDTLNFYEYREPLRYDASDPPGWRGNEIAIDFGQITAVKEAKDSVNAKASRRVPVPNGAPGATYQVVGNPTLTGIRFLCVGVTNPSNKGTRWLTGQVWVDEMRLSKVNDAKGWAYRFDASIKLADFGSVQVNMSKIDPNFHGLEQRFGSRNTSVSWGFGGNFSLQRFLPREWSGTALSFTYSHTEGFDVPQYVPGTDVLVDEAATRANEVAAGTGDSIRTASQTLRVSDTWTIPSVKVNIPSNAWYVRDIINRLSLSFNYNSSKERNPTTVYRTSWTWNSSLNYSLSLSPDYYIVPFKDLFNGIFLLDAYKDVKIYFTPSSVNFGVNGTRSRTEEQPRTQTGIRPPVRNFTANRQFSVNYRMSEGGLLNLATDYSMSVASSLVHLEVDTSLGSEFPRQRSSSEIFGDIFFKEGIINFGFPSSYNQTITISSRPKLPPLLDIDRYLEITPNYSASYSWQNNFQQRDFGRSASVNSTLQLSVGFRLKQLTDPWFKTSSRQLPTAPSPRQRGEAIDTSGQRPQEGTPKDTTKSSALGNLAEILKIAIKIPFLDYDNITINFTQNNSSQNNGILGDGTGFMNLWGRVPFFQSSLDANGPSRLYQLGLIGYPNGRVTGFGLRPYFPFFGFNVEPGLRAPTPANMQVQMTDVFSQRNQFDIRTSRPLWEGARLDLNWKVGWSFSRNQTIQTDTLGVPTVVSIAEQGDVDRSFLSLPDIFPFNIVATSGIAQVGKLYDKYKSDQSDTRSDPEKLAQAFQEGMESLPFLTKIIGNVLPRANWVLRWDGLEKLSFLERVASRVSLEHSYTSQYTGRYRITTDGTQVTESQRVSYGFNPLLGVNITFKELWGGSFGGSFRFSMQTAYDLANGSQNINETSSTEASLMASYGRRGFEIPLFGLSLRNDVDISFSFTYSKQSRRTYDVNNLSAEGTPLEGQSRTQIEPRFKYVLSTRVTASLFYRYVKTAPDATAARIPGTTTNELGLEVHISISGQ